jgi:formamidopyrimidine-DNA glycosylase
MKLTLRDRYVRYLVANGYTEAKSRSFKYIVYAGKNTEDRPFYYHVGMKGGVRWSVSGSITDSHDAVSLKYRMPRWEKDQGLGGGEDGEVKEDI